jgi:hypothetical protein
MRRILGCLTAALMGGAAFSSMSAAPFEIDKPFPALVLPALHDQGPNSLAEFRGRKTVLHVFASW